MRLIPYGTRKRRKPKDPREDRVLLDEDMEWLREWLLFDAGGFPRLTFMRLFPMVSSYVLDYYGPKRIFFANGNRLDCRRENLVFSKNNR